MDNLPASMDAKKRKYMAVAREIEAAVKAGKLSKEDAQKKLNGLRKEMFGHGYDPPKRSSSTNREIEEKQIRYEEMKREIGAAVKAGKLSEEDAKKKLDGLRRSFGK